MRLMLRVLAAITALAMTTAPSAAIVGGAQPMADRLGRSVVTIIGSRGNFCSGVALTRDLVLTAAHCVLPGAIYKLVEYEGPQPALRDVAAIKHHPKFDVKELIGHRATADVALVKLAAPLKGAVPATLGASDNPVAPGDPLMVAGAGVAARGDGKSGGTVRAATLVATGRPGNLQIRLVDPATKGAWPGLGACTGDSGAPVFRDTGGRTAVIGVVSWSTGPNNTGGCGGLTGVTPLSLYRKWIVEMAKVLGSPIEP